MKILITGAAGFIGFNLSRYLLEKDKKISVIGVDSENDYYSIKLKKKRVSELRKFKKFSYLKLNISNKKNVKNLFKKNRIDCVVHLAAQAGVRYSVVNPDAYIESNINGFLNIIKNSKDYKIKKFIYASSSSVYGESKSFPLKEGEFLDPLNLYGLTKKFNEETSKLFYENYKFPSIGIRFFTVFGEWGRPDMFLFKYLSSITNKKKFTLNNRGKHYRDFTYIHDVTKVLFKLIKTANNKNEIFNLCSNQPIGLLKIIDILDRVIKKRPRIIMAKRQQADILKTHGNNRKILGKLNGFRFTNFQTALVQTSNWFIKNKKLY